MFVTESTALGLPVGKRRVWLDVLGIRLPPVLAQASDLGGHPIERTQK